MGDASAAYSTGGARNKGRPELAVAGRREGAVKPTFHSVTQRPRRRHHASLSHRHSTQDLARSNNTCRRVRARIGVTNPRGAISGQCPNGSTEFPRGFPTYETIERLYDEADLNRAIQTYKFFYPNIAMAGFADGFEKFSPVNNKTFFILSAAPKQNFFTANSDTPYALLPLDLRAGPITIELPAGPLIGVANDWNFRWVMDMGLPGPDAGKGGKHIILPPASSRSTE